MGGAKPWLGLWLPSVFNLEGGDLRSLVSPDCGTPSTPSRLYPLPTVTIVRKQYVTAAYWNLTLAHSAPLGIRLIPWPSSTL